MNKEKLFKFIRKIFRISKRTIKTTSDGKGNFEYRTEYKLTIKNTKDEEINFNRFIMSYFNFIGYKDKEYNDIVIYELPVYDIVICELPVYEIAFYLTCSVTDFRYQYFPNNTSSSNNVYLEFKTKEELVNYILNKHFKDELRDQKLTEILK